MLVNGSTLRQANLPCAGEHLKFVREREQARREEQQRIASTDTGTQTLQNTGLWMDRTRWPIAYQGVRRDILLVTNALAGRLSWEVDCTKRVG